MSDDEDVDTDENWGDTPTVDFNSGTITAVFDVDPYLACPTPSCNNTKLTPVESNSGSRIMNCKNCGRNYGESACNNYLRATVMIEVEESNLPPPRKWQYLSRRLKSSSFQEDSHFLPPMTKLSFSSNSLKLFQLTSSFT